MQQIGVDPVHFGVLMTYIFAIWHHRSAVFMWVPV
ncbi:hypothetical protein [Aeromonas media]